MSNDLLANSTVLKNGGIFSYDLSGATVEPGETNWWDPSGDGASIWFRIDVPEFSDDGLYIAVPSTAPEARNGWLVIAGVGPDPGVAYIQINRYDSGSFYYLNVLQTADGSPASSPSDFVFVMAAYTEIPGPAGELRVGFPVKGPLISFEGEAWHKLLYPYQWHSTAYEGLGAYDFYDGIRSTSDGHGGTYSQWAPAGGNSTTDGIWVDDADSYGFRIDAELYPDAPAPLPPGDAIDSQWITPGAPDLDHVWLLSINPSAPSDPQIIGEQGTAPTHCGAFRLHRLDSSWVPPTSWPFTPGSTEMPWDHSTGAVFTFPSSGLSSAFAIDIGAAPDGLVFLATLPDLLAIISGATGPTWVDGFPLFTDGSHGSFGSFVEVPPPLYVSLTGAQYQVLSWPRLGVAPLRMRQRDDGARRYGRSGPSSVQASPRRHGRGGYA